MYKVTTISIQIKQRPFYSLPQIKTNHSRLREKNTSHSKINYVKTKGTGLNVPLTHRAKRKGLLCVQDEKTWSLDRCRVIGYILEVWWGVPLFSIQFPSVDTAVVWKFSLTTRDTNLVFKQTVLLQGISMVTHYISLFWNIQGSQKIKSIKPFHQHRGIQYGINWHVISKITINVTQLLHFCQRPKLSNHCRETEVRLNKRQK